MPSHLEERLESSQWPEGWQALLSHHFPLLCSHQLHLPPCCSLTIFRILPWLEDSSPMFSQLISNHLQVFALVSPSYSIQNCNLFPLPFTLLYFSFFFMTLTVFNKKQNGTSLVAQWLRTHLPMQGTQVRSLVWEDPTCRGATKPESHNYWARVLQLLKAAHLEPMLHNKRSHCNEKPVHRNNE